MKKIAQFALVIFGLAFVGCGGGPKVSLDVQREPSINTSGIQRIAVMPFESDFQYQNIAKYATEVATKQIQGTNKFTLVSPATIQERLAAGKTYDDIVDAIFVGKILVIPRISYQDATRTKPDGKKEDYTQYTQRTSIVFDYKLIRAKDGAVIGQVTKNRGATKTNNEGPDNFPPIEATANEVINNQMSLLYRDFIPYNIKVERKLAEESNKTLKPQMESALELVKANNFTAARDAYINIYRSSKSVAAATNAAVLIDALGDTKAAAEFMRQVYAETGDADAGVAAADYFLSGMESVIEYRAAVDLRRQIANKPKAPFAVKYSLPHYEKGLQEFEAAYAGFEEEKADAAKRLENSGSFTDKRDGKVYRTIKIGEQNWMAENLNYQAGESKCYGEGNEALDVSYKNFITLAESEVQTHCSKYGRLYDYNTALNACPEGWALPNNDDWYKLFVFADDSSKIEDAPKDGELAGTKFSKTAGKNLKSASDWRSYQVRTTIAGIGSIGGLGFSQNKSGNGTNKFGFAALPAGIRDRTSDNAKKIVFNGVNTLSFWWSTNFENNKYNLALIGYNGDVAAVTIKEMSQDLYSIRCIEKSGEQQSSVAPTTAPVASEAKTAECPSHNQETHFCDSRDGKIYKIAKIGNQTWMAENLRYEQGGICYENYEEEGENTKEIDCEKYGRLYEVEDRNICPAGWHLPKSTEFDALIAAVGGEKTAAKHLKAKTEWDNNGNGTDDHGFAALPGGYSGGGGVEGAGTDACWWASDERFCLKSDSELHRFRASNFEDPSMWFMTVKDSGFSIRCLKD